VLPKTTHASAIPCLTGITPDQGYTAGSKSIQEGSIQVRREAAQARAALPDTVAAAGVLVAPGALELRTFEVPTPGPGQALVQIRATALCTWEQRVYAGIDDWSYPLVGGHEFSGDVVAIGSEVAQPLQPGDQVAVAGLRRCGECWACRRGYDNICDHQHAVARAAGKAWGPGGFGQFALVEGYQVYQSPRPVSPYEAALAEPPACVLHDVKRFPPRRGDTAVIAAKAFRRTGSQEL